MAVIAANYWRLTLLALNTLQSLYDKGAMTLKSAEISSEDVEHRNRQFRVLTVLD
jgi:hypothetical protein